MVGSFHRARQALFVCMAAVGTACGDLDSTGEAMAARGPTASERAFSVSVAAGTETISQGATATYTIATDAAERDSQPLSLSVTGLPAGVTAVIAPSTLNSGETALLELSVSPTAAPAAATFTVTAVARKGSTRKATGQVAIVTRAP